MPKPVQCAGKLIAIEHFAMEPSPNRYMNPDAPVVFIFAVGTERLEISVPVSSAGFCLRALQKWANKVGDANASKRRLRLITKGRR